MATPLVEETEDKTQAKLNPILEAGKIPVVTGFISATAEGVPTTLGRGGSDYSVTILGRAMGADEIWIWTDVNGVMTTDPRIVPNAKTIPQLSFVEVGELAYFGARVLHPRAIRPARQANIPVRMLNTFQPDHPGTLINREVNDSDHAVKAITAIKDMSIITVAGTGMIGIPGVAGRTFSAVAQTGTSVLMISQASSEQSICFVVSTDEADIVVGALEQELSRELERRDLDQISAQHGTVILAVVGAGMKGTPGISARIFGALGKAKINIIAIAQGSSEYNISLVIAQGEANQAVRLIHDEFRLYE
jgi:aspartate kinase